MYSNLNLFWIKAESLLLFLENALVSRQDRAFEAVS